MRTKKILVVLTNTKQYGKHKEKTGLWLGEATEFINFFQKSEINFEFDFISPNGGKVPIDPRSLKYASEEDIKLYNERWFIDKALNNSLKPSDVKNEQYDCIYFTGGHGVMWDFTNNKEIHDIALSIYKNNKIVSSVCHGIAGLLYLKDEDNKFIIENKSITGFTTWEEILSGKYRKVPFLNKRVAIKNKANFKTKRFYKPYALKDGNLITGQNPFSVIKVAKLILEII
ncbi:type 1 glutamine amidotransferase domain-containing protein [Mesoplasma tabanidae]|uniref:Peptidase C56 n=1 Tax=Mesoplasma tabanidae TaxID=219745 RepID=A0A2K8P4I2_9MOLU|nr:type 1 glutamine amidotransferase domain-containing protein [Mesoplasma tabanidae]ATZ21652.1 peptidase C56 [Mesoplasma tabanidae]